MKIRYGLVAAVLAAGGAVACDPGEAPDAVQESPTAAPGMQEDEVAPTVGPGATEPPEIGG